MLAIVILSGVFPMASLGQTPCDLLIVEAERNYEDGNFEKVPPLLEMCLKKTRRERTQALTLLAKTYVVTGDYHRARSVIATLLRLEPDFEGDPLRDPSRFIRLLEDVKRESATVQVASVSKTQESLREAPATVVVVTGEEIERRGYIYLEELLHDLPGFDITRTYGFIYSNIYQRGLRSDLNTRTLLLIDGVEENELWSQSTEIGGQYPLINVERVEVVYGPASTMYGPSAFAGVINVITKDPESLLAEGRGFAGKVHLTSGSFDTNYIDAILAGRTKNGSMSWSLTSRFFQSDGMDLSSFDDWDFDPAVFAGAPYGDLLGIRGVDADENFLAQQYLEATGLGPSPYYTIQTDATGTATSIELTSEGTARALALDQAAYSQELFGQPISYSNTANDRYVYAKLKISNLLLGFMNFSYEEGTGGWFTDRWAPGADNGSRWHVEFSWLYAKYSRSIGENLSLNFFARYKRHGLGNRANLTTLTRSYAGRTLDLQNLVDGTPAGWRTEYISQASSQLRAEVTTIYSPSEKFSLVSGIELRSGNIDRTFVISLQPNPSETGSPVGNFPGDNDLETTDLGLFAQLSYKPWERFKVVVGGRVDNNEVRESLGYGTVFVPRLALIYMPGDFVFKAIYSEAFQPASNAQKYLISPGRIELPSADLQPEEIESFELSVNWQPIPDFAFELSAYDATVTDVVQLLTVPCDQEGCTGPTTGGFRGIGAQAIRGAQATASWRRERFSLSANYTYTDPVNSDPRGIDGDPQVDGQGNRVRELRVGDITDHQVNLQLEARLWKNLDLNVQANYVGTKKTGARTTVATNPLDAIDSYLVANATLSYKDLWAGLSLQLIVNNVFDERYYHPGGRIADGIVNASRVPQADRTVFGRILFSF